MMMICDYAKSRQQGISLIEALITMVVLSVGLLSVAALQTRALQASHLSYQRSIAVSQANDAVERLWAGICQIFDQTDEQKDNGLFPPIEDIKENLKIIEEDWQSVHNNKMIVDIMAENWDGSINIDENEDGGGRLITVEIKWNDGRVESSEFVYNITMLPELGGCTITCEDCSPP